jgi:serine protease Do
MRTQKGSLVLPAFILALLLAAALNPILAPGHHTAHAQAVEPSPLRSYADVAEVASPAVVNIQADKVVELGSNHPFLEDPMFRRFFNMPDDENHRGEQVNKSLGSGVVISSDGYIITNNHVVENASKIRVTFQGEKEYEAEIIGTDPRTDVALIKIEETGLPAIEIADSDQLRVGDQVMAIGNPFGVGQTVTLGIVSALGRTIGLIDYEDLIQTDASINPGNSGGALVNMRGQLVGMNAAILSRSGGSQGIGFAIPTAMAMRIVDALKADGKVQRAYLGVLPQAVDQAMANYYGLDSPRGVLVAQVNEDTPAQKAGLKDGDIILSVNDQEMKNPSNLRNTISLSEVGQKVNLRIIRDGKEKNVEVKLEAFPDPQRTAQAGPSEDPDEDVTLDGVTIREITGRMRAMIELPEDIEGLLVTGVERASNAAEQGLAEGDVILEVSNQKVADFAAFKKALKINTDRPVFMKVYKPRQQRTIYLAIPRQ